jgi:peroxiredoxin
MLTFFKPAAATCLIFACACSSAAAPAASRPAEAVAAPRPAAGPPAAEALKAAERSAAALEGTTPPEWQPDRWLNSAPMRLADLRGKVVLVRWWTAGCPFCSASAPALRAFDREYGPKGLAVIGLYHHKGGDPFDPAVYQDTAKRYGFTFPLAVDPEWRTLKSWLNGVDTGWTSVTFVLDKKGVVRHVHPGGQYVEGDVAHAQLKAAVERLMAEG